MQDGDLAEFHQERLIVVLEGVLALVAPEKQAVGRWRRRVETVAYHVLWHEVPLKRLVMINERHPEFDVEILTFHDPTLADQAAEFLDQAGIPYGSVRYQAYATFTQLLRYQRNIRTIYDSDPDRLDDYGQLGTAVVRGQDF